MIGLRLNNYEVVSLLGEGGMGTVYLARHTFMGRRAAIKFLRPELLRDASIVARFLDESRATNAIGHPNIIDIIDVGLLSDGGTPYLMMEFLDGESLSQRLERSRPLPIHEAVEIACQTASALAAAHTRMIVHRDLKPDNLFLLPDESRVSNLRVKVLDFGIAKLRGDARGGAVKTQTGAIMGTPLYMSPEQCRGISEDIDHRTDIYALGTILYEMLCGEAPFPGEGLGDILMRHMSEAPVPLRARVAEIPESIDRAVLRALAKKREDRFDSMDDFARAIREYDPKAAKTAQVARRHDSRPLPPGLSATVLDANATPAPVLLAPGTGPIPAPASVPKTVLMPRTEPTWVSGPSLAGAHTTLSSATGAMRAETEVIVRRSGRRVLAIGVVAAGALALTVGIIVVSVRSPSPLAANPMVAPAAAPPAPAVLPPPSPPPPAVLPPPAPPAVAPPPVAEPLPATVPGKKGARRKGKDNSAPANPVVTVKPTLAPAPAPAPMPAAAPAQVPGAGPKGGYKW